ncbi:hypothetical protein HK104_009694 [Borealophlyctis nickersoniae]|nr:hypothetical protein HK104_009694 [Borealophlyctis nickersoniae]
MPDSAQSNNQTTLHSHNMYPDQNKTQSDPKIVYPYAERNKDPILNTISPYLQQAKRVLELASGSGQHVSHWARSFPSIHFQPSEIDNPPLHASIKAYTTELSNVAPPMVLNSTEPAHWDRVVDMVNKDGPFDVVYIGNVFHITPWEVTQAVAKNVPKVLPGNSGTFIVYGPFKKDGKFTTPSNEEFDQNLRARNNQWGVRDIADVAAEFKQYGLALKDVKDMPANNFILVFQREGGSS